LLLLEQRALFALSSRIPYQARPPAGQGDRTVTCKLQAAEHAQLEEVPHVEAVGSRVEADVPRDGSAREPLAEARTSGLVPEPPELEIFG
jgi:hypothetical protein